MPLIHPPTKQKQRRLSIKQVEIAEAEVDKMLEDDIIEPSNGAWLSNYVLVKKKDGSSRFCVDFREVNAFTRKDALTFGSHR